MYHAKPKALAKHNYWPIVTSNQMNFVAALCDSLVKVTRSKYVDHKFHFILV